MLVPYARRCLIAIALIGMMAVPAAADVTIHCIYVGQADATLIQSSSGQTLLFDGGNNGDGHDIIIPLLTSLGITQLDYMASSHYHADHIGGLDEVFLAVGVANSVYDRGWSYTTATYNSYANAVSSKRATVTDGQVFDLGDGVTCTVLGLNGNGVSSSPYSSSSRENEYSMALLVECGDFDFFVAGDLTGGYSSERDVETSIGLEAGDIEVYQVDHHGSYTSTNQNFLNSTTPEVGIVSCPVSSPYGHPHQDPMDRMAAMGMYLYQMAQGSSSTYPAGMREIINTVHEEHASAQHVVITSDGYGEYFVNGDQWTMDEPDETAVPYAGTLTLLGNRPNPFNPATEIRFETFEGGPTSLTIYDLGGRSLRTADLIARPGLTSWRWDGRDGLGHDVPSGVYVYRVISAEGAGTGRMILAR